MKLNKNLCKIIAGIFIMVLAILFTGCSKNNTSLQKEKLNQFSLSVSGLIEVRDTIQVNQTISDILLPHGLSQKKINEIEKASKEIFPLNKIVAGKELFVYAKWDSVETVKYLVYKIDEIDHVVFDLRDTIKIYKAQRPSRIEVREAKGVIKSSLTEDLESLGFHKDVAFNTADIFESRIDFGLLQENDQFDIFFEQIYVDDKPVKIGKIFAAKINHLKKDNFAFLFEKDKKVSYYDETGGSLHGLFLTAPIKFKYRITSKFSSSRYHPILHRNKAHLGTDYAAPTGTPIMTVGNGVVVEVGYSSGNGNYVKVKHNATYTTQYLHMSHFAKGIRKGTHVSQGETIGYVGSTGLATGPHVCFRFWKNGVQVNPQKQMGQASEPLNKKDFPQFKVVLNEWLPKFNSTVNQTATSGTSTGKTKS
jgi:murein DD-endopeptidase MepM/ murein hydrolase activator NlpD